MLNLVAMPNQHKLMLFCLPARNPRRKQRGVVWVLFNRKFCLGETRSACSTESIVLQSGWQVYVWESHSKIPAQKVCTKRKCNLTEECGDFETTPCLPLRCPQAKSALLSNRNKQLTDGNFSRLTSVLPSVPNSWKGFYSLSFYRISMYDCKFMYEKLNSWRLTAITCSYQPI